ncbi:MAG: cation:dicarboxylase symporter family transporter [Clostridiales bacterium]|nr:cation:dicarboxylase symporter family transporter [Clostridiales bacterium]
MRKKKLSLAVKIIVGLVLGVVVGAVFYGNANVEKYLAPLGDIFIRLMEMIVIPIVVSSIVVGVSGVGDIKKLGRLGGKTLIYFEVVTTFAIVIGLVVANMFKPGVGININDLSSVDACKMSAESANSSGLMNTLVNIVPSNVFYALSSGNMLAIIFFSILFGLGIATLDEKERNLLNSIFDGVTKVMFWVTNLVMKLAPIGVFSLIAVTVSKFGISSMLSLGKLTGLIYFAMILFVVLVLGVVCKLFKINFGEFLKYIKDEIILSFTTASSEAVLPSIMRKMEEYGCPKAITSFVIPTGYSFNLAGSTLYQAIAVIFIVEICKIDLTIAEQIKILLVLMLTSKGVAGVPGVSLIVLLATLKAIGVPTEGLVLVAGIDRILDMGRTAVNVIGNALAVVVLSKWEHQWDEKKARDSVYKIDAGSTI